MHAKYSGERVRVKIHFIKVFHILRDNNFLLGMNLLHYKFCCNACHFQLSSQLDMFVNKPLIPRKCVSS